MISTIIGMIIANGHAVVTLLVKCGEAIRRNIYCKERLMAIFRWRRHSKLCN